MLTPIARLLAAGDEQLQRVHQARSWPVEVRRAIEHDHLCGTGRFDLGPDGVGLLLSASLVKATRREDEEDWPGCSDGIPRDRNRRHAGACERVIDPGKGQEVRGPVARAIRR